MAPQTCYNCRGSGQTRCSACSGRGYKIQFTATGSGMKSCYSCGGRRTLRCPSCQGRGDIPRLGNDDSAAGQAENADAIEFLNKLLREMNRR